MIIDRISPGCNGRERPGSGAGGGGWFVFPSGTGRGRGAGGGGKRGCGELKMTPLISGLNGAKRINKKLRAINSSHEHVPVTSGLAA